MSLLTDARTAALGALIDYAGLFPPASLPLEDAVAAYRRLRSAPDGWLVGRFLCPTSVLEDLAAVLTRTMDAEEPPWAVGAIFDEDVGRAADHAATFHHYASPAALVSTAEVALPRDAGGDDIRTIAVAAMGIDGETVPFLEVPLSAEWEAEIPATIDAISRVRSDMRRTTGAKLRCGGTEPSAFPSPEQVAMFLMACERRGLPFKATAGLHHPVRHLDEELGVMRHGFVNLLAAAAVAAENGPFHDVAAVVAETDPAAFELGAGSLSYREHRFPTRVVAAVRSGAFVAYGSCDVDEPIVDLRAMGFIS